MMCKGLDGSFVVLFDGKFVVYIGYDYSCDIYIDSCLYVMNFDGIGYKIISGDFDCLLSGLCWVDDLSGVYFNVLDSGICDFYFVLIGGKLC